MPLLETGLSSERLKPVWKLTPPDRNKDVSLPTRQYKLCGRAPSGNTDSTVTSRGFAPTSKSNFKSISKLQQIGVYGYSPNCALQLGGGDSRTSCDIPSKIVSTLSLQTLASMRVSYVYLDIFGLERRERGNIKVLEVEP